MFKQMVILLIALFSLFGCQQNNDSTSLGEQETSDQKINVENTTINNKKDLTNTEIADHLVGVADSIPEVNGATAIVAGPYAVVGLNLDAKLDRSRVGIIKYSVLEALHEDPYGKTAVVVADGDIFERLKEMNNKLQQGYPIQGVVEELAGIVNRYMPNFPVPEQAPVEPDQNKEQLPDGKKEDLDDIQDEQSNDHIDQQEE